MPFFLYVRDGPLAFLVILVLGLLVGRLGLKIGDAGEKEIEDRSGGLWVGPHVAGFRWHGGPRPGRWARFFAVLSGVAWTPQSAKAAEFRTRVVGGLVVLGIAVYQGFRILYMGDPTFGDGGIFDYAAVLVWALAADGGQRYLANLKWP
ncbi:MAG: hypothetical protein ACQET1_09945 [Gemmatimonadota bacterium]